MQQILLIKVRATSAKCEPEDALQAFRPSYGGLKALRPSSDADMPLGLGRMRVIHASLFALAAGIEVWTMEMKAKTLVFCPRSLRNARMLRRRTRCASTNTVFF